MTLALGLSQCLPLPPSGALVPRWHQGSISARTSRRASALRLSAPLNAEIVRRAGHRSDLRQNLGGSSDHRVKDERARLAGFGNRETARQARKVVETRAPELVEAMDKGRRLRSASPLCTRLLLLDRPLNQAGFPEGRVQLIAHRLSGLGSPVIRGFVPSHTGGDGIDR